MRKIKILMFDSKTYSKESFESINHDGIEFSYVDFKLTPETVDLAKDYDSVCVFVNDVVNKEVVDKLVKFGIKAIFLRCAGYNNVDLEACKGKLKVYRVPSYSPYAVAEFTMALLLTSNRRIHKAYNRTREFNFSLEGFTGVDLHGKTIGIIGTGKIGRILADICGGFGMNVIAYDILPAKNVRKFKYVSFEELIRTSDFISLHCPLTEYTKHLINVNTISQMKKGVMIINTSRGSLIDSEALLEGIKSRKISGACLDVYEEEADYFFEDKSNHILNDDVLRDLISMPNVIVTSHQAFLTKEALENIVITTIGNIDGFFNKKPAVNNEVNYVKE